MKLLLLGGTRAGQVASQYTALVLDSKLAGESKTAPHIRIPTLPEDYFQKIVCAFTTARGTCGTLGPKDLLIVADGFKPGRCSLRPHPHQPPIVSE